MWTHKLPKINGYYWFRSATEHGMAAVTSGEAELVSWAKLFDFDELNDDNQILSTIGWEPEEEENEAWEWYRIEFPE